MVKRAFRTGKEIERIEIFRYHDYRAFLVDWLAYRKATERRFSWRKLATQAGLATGMLPMILSGKCPLSIKAMKKLQPHLALTETELSFLENLVYLGTSDSQDERLTALERMKRFHRYRELHQNESEVHQYMTHWYYAAIREMACLRDFRLEPEWIQSALTYSVSLKEVKDAIEFLTKNGYLQVTNSGVVIPPQKVLDCSGGIYRLSLSQFHKEALELASQAIEKIPSDKRNVQGHTFSLNSRNYLKAQAIVDEAIQRVRELGKAETRGDAVYQMEISLFPLAHTSPQTGAPTKEDKE